MAAAEDRMTTDGLVAADVTQQQARGMVLMRKQMQHVERENGDLRRLLQDAETKLVHSASLSRPSSSHSVSTSLSSASSILDDDDGESKRPIQERFARLQVRMLIMLMRIVASSQLPLS
jgi:hypothetical protein